MIIWDKIGYNLDLKIHSISRSELGLLLGAWTKLRQIQMSKDNMEWDKNWWKF